jgi:hypothetical protein
MLQEYSQQIGQGCLAVCLLQLTKTRITKNKEWEVLEYAFKFSKDNFAIGHLDYVAKKYDIKLNNYWDNKEYSKYLTKMKISKNISINHKKIDLNLVNKLIKKSPIILQIDSYAFWKITHVSHFVIILEKNKDGYKVFDPWFGKTFQKSTEQVSKGIKSLRNLLKFYPQIIQRGE